MHLSAFRSPSRRRRAIAMAGAVVAVSSLALTACSAGDGGGSDDGALQILVIKHPLTQEMSKMQWAADLEEQLGVDIEWQEVSADWDQKKSAILASGDIPDLIVGTNAITDSDLATYGTLFEDLSAHLDDLPNVQGMFEAQPLLQDMATQSGGEIYSVPGYKRFWPETVIHQYINQQWLDELGLEMPTTWDELFDVLVAFRDEDANGDGDPSDEIPWDWSAVGTGGFGYFQPSVLLGSLGLPISSGGGAGYFLEDGEVGNFLVDDRYRQMVEFLHRAYAEGLISQEVMTHDYSAYQSTARGDGDTAAVGFSWGWTASDRFGAQLAPQYAAMAPLLAEEGQSEPVTWSYDGYGENFPANQIAMSASSDNKEAALAAIDAFYDQDMSIQVLFGDFGTNVEKVDDTTYRVLPPADGTSDPSTWKWTSSLADNGPMWIRDDIEVELPTDLQEARDQTVPLEDALANMDLEEDVYPTQFIKMSAEDLNTISLNNTTILNLTQTKFAEWVTQGGIEDQWDDYVAQVEGAGLVQNIEIHQSYYDDFIAG
ncbi:type 2 periplasmic-binding domain-containing protein [Microbacterium gilvum]|uniref:ABC transporter substrate-binding protein n=1 Tax=Microbacterium gilvum TaxID=1336204 RepID=A0ABP9AKD5_9MICO